MSGNLHAALLVAVMAVMTALLRFLPFLVFRHKVPSYVMYLGEVLPAAIIGMLVIYCLKDVTLHRAPFGDPSAYEVLGAAIALRRSDTKKIMLEELP